MNKKTSIIISDILVKVFILALITTLFAIPYVAQWYDIVSGEAPVWIFLMVVLYLCDAACFVLALALQRLLANIRRGQVFVNSNARCLQVISYSLFAASAFLAVFGIARRPFTFSFVFVTFLLAVVIRVLYNVFVEAISLQNEQDFTI